MLSKRYTFGELNRILMESHNEFNPKIGGPFEDSAKYEANRDNKENSKNFKSEGGPFEKDGTVDSEDMQSDKLETGKGDDVYKKKVEYVPEDSVAAMNPSGGEVTRVKVNESLEEEVPVEDNPELGALSTDEILSKFNDEDEEAQSNFEDEISAEMNNPRSSYEGPDVSYEFDQPHVGEVSADDEIAGIDDMSGVDRNNLSSDVIDDAVNESVNGVLKRKNLDMLAESVVEKILKESDDDRLAMYGPDDFKFNGPNYDGTSKTMKGSTSSYTGAKRVANLHKNQETGEQELYDDSPNAPKFVNPRAVEYDKNSPFYGKKKYELNLNDDPEAEDNDEEYYKKTGAWTGTEEMSRKFINYFLADAVAQLKAKGADNLIDVNKMSNIYRQSASVLQGAKNDAAEILGTSPEMIENFLSTNYSFGQDTIEDEEGKYVGFGDAMNAAGFRDAKTSTQCYITPDGELPMTKENKAWCDENMGGTIVGPSLKAVGYMHKDGSDLSTEELSELVNGCDEWFRQWEKPLTDAEDNFKAFMPEIQKLVQSEYWDEIPNLRSTCNQFMNLAESFGPLMSLFIVPMEALNRRDDAADLAKGRGGNMLSKGEGEELNEEVTKLNDFGKHPGYRKKPMNLPEPSEVAPNGARDWNDDSTKGSEPFGKQIGSSAPFTELVKTITNQVIKALQGGAE